MKREFYFSRLNGLSIRVATCGRLLWISYGHAAQYQFSIVRWGWQWLPMHNYYWLGFFLFIHYG